MTLRISGKQMELGESLETRIKERIDDAVEKYFGNGYSGHVTVEKDGNFFVADCMVHLNSGVVLQTSAREAEPKAAFDHAAERIETRLRRYKRKLRDHHQGHRDEISLDAAYAIMSTPPADQELEESDAPVVVAESSRSVRTQTVADAVMQLELMDHPVNVFTNAGTGSINVVYRREDGNIGWIDPSAGTRAG